MPEKIPYKQGNRWPYSHNPIQARYEEYKDTIDYRNEREALLSDKSFRGTVKRLVKSQITEPGKWRDGYALSTEEALQNAKADLMKHEAEIKREAVHDFNSDYNNDPNRFENKPLNLPESGLPETVKNVKVIQEQ